MASPILTSRDHGLTITSTWRYRTLMTRLEKMHGKITGDGNGETADPIKQTSARKRKRNERQGATKKSETKKAKVDIGEKEDEADLTEATSSDDILTGNGKEA